MTLQVFQGAHEPCIIVDQSMVFRGNATYLLNTDFPLSLPTWDGKVGTCCTSVTQLASCNKLLNLSVYNTKCVAKTLKLNHRGAQEQVGDNDGKFEEKGKILCKRTGQKWKRFWFRLEKQLFYYERFYTVTDGQRCVHFM